MVGWYSGTPFLFFWRQYTEQFTDNQVDHLEDNLTYLKQNSPGADDTSALGVFRSAHIVFI